MKRWLFLQLALCGLLIGVQSVHAGAVSLADWCFNVNGSIDSCNGGPGLASVDLSAFDPTLESVGTNTLGSATVTLSEGNNFVGFYADYDVDFPTFGSFDDFGAVTIVPPPANWSFEFADPNASNIFSDFQSLDNSTPLPGSNTVGVPSGPPANCCDVSWALGLTNIVVDAGGSATVTFTVSTVAPTSGFYMVQTNTDTHDSIYLSALVNTNPGTGNGNTPEPSTFAMGLGAVGLAMMMARKRRVSTCGK
jgi:hypothetical protein